MFNKIKNLFKKNDELTSEIEDNRKAKEEADRLSGEEVAKRLEDEKRIREDEIKIEAERKAREEAELRVLEEKAKLLEEEVKLQEEEKTFEAERKAREEAEKLAGEEVVRRLEDEKRIREDELKIAAEKEARERAEKRAKEEEAKLKEEEAKLKEEEELLIKERKAREEAERKLAELQEKREEEERRIKEEEELLEKEKEAREEVEKKLKQEEEKSKKGFFKSLKEKLVKSVSKDGLFGKIKTLFSGRSVIDEEMYEELEDLLIQSDIGMDMTLKIVNKLEEKVKELKITEPEKVYDALKLVMHDFLLKEENDLKVYKPGLNVLLVVGVNGVGKTTTIGKIAAKLVKEGKKVVIGAGDTFRAAAIEQLEEWADRSGAELIKHEQGSDPGAVVYDTIAAAQNKNADIAIIDTAGRLHNKNNLMKELEKINKIIKKQIGENTEYESLLVIDGTTGQNGLTQAQVFNEVTELTGFVVTKLDGTAKGGIIFAVSEEVRRPIKFIGVGEGIDDLREFNADEYIKAIFE